MMRFLYEILQQILYWPDVRWKAYLLGLAVTKYVLKTYLDYRQYYVLSRTSTPRVLRNIITPEEFTKRQDVSRTAIKYEFWGGLYWLVFVLSLALSEDLSKLWTITGPAPNLSRFWMKHWISEETSHCMRFYAAASLIWTVITLPDSYYQKCVRGEYTSETKTVHRWMKYLLTRQAKKLVASTATMYFTLPVLQRRGTEAVVRIFFNGLCIFFMICVLVLLLQSVIFPRVFKSRIMEPGETKTAIQNLAIQLHFSLEEIYIRDCSERKHATSNVFAFGPAWRTNIMFDDFLDGYNTEEIVALAAHEMGSLKHNMIQQIISLTLLQALFSVRVLVMFINWRGVCHSFGFIDEHPIIVLVLLFGNALEPVHKAVSLFSRSVKRRFESKADRFVAEQGYGQQLSRALIKMNKSKTETLKADWMYSLFCNNGHLPLSERLEALGWTGDEEVLEDDSKLHDPPEKASDSLE